MRIIAGKLKGRIIAQTHGRRTHPMSEKIRGALFNALGGLEDLIVLDAFAGTGAVAIEAISRGAEHVIAIDQDKAAYNTISKNVRDLSLEDQVKVISANVNSWSDLNANQLFDVVIADPPHDDVKAELLSKVARHTKPHGVLVASLPTNSNLNLGPDFSQLSTKNYGDAKLLFFRRML